MAKIAIFVEKYTGFMRPYINNMVRVLSLSELEYIYVYGPTELEGLFKEDTVIQSDLAYFSINYDPRVYEGFLNFCSENKIDKVFIPGLLHPEYLYSELLNRKIVDFELSISIFSFELFSKSSARCALMSELVALPNIKNILVHSILGGKLRFPMRLFENRQTNKYTLSSEPTYESIEGYGKPMTGLRQGKFKVLYFGNMFYGKGVDILSRSLNYLGDDVEVTFAGDIAGRNFDFDLEIIAKNKHVLIPNHISEELMYELFANTNLVILPYRDTYMYGTSGVFHQAMLAGKPILVPNFYPFDEAITLYGCGEIFISEDSKSIAEKIMYIKLNGSEKYTLGIDSYLKEIENWSSFSRKILQ